ncbi:MAG TPA: DUF4321 domain-containing protein [Candidatus Latescibacteria bacterium]|nr:DUF4321 domain-containing protein [Candidatus Latescibacterota bacterium]
MKTRIYRRKTIGLLIVLLCIGLLIGTVVGEILGFLLPENNVVRKVLVNSFRYELQPLTINLIVFSITFGFGLNFNLITLIGIVLAWYYYKYSY